MKILKPFLVASILITVISCTKEITHEKLIAERQADEKIKASVIDIDATQITFAKASLGKAFILIPTMTSSGSHPDVNFLKPLIVSFEKVGKNVALFNLTEEQLYDTVPSRRLLQTFTVLEENATTFAIELGKGFTSINGQDSLTIADNATFTKSKRAIESGQETSVDIKDSFVREASSADSAVYIKQEIRVRSVSLKDLPDKEDPSKIKNQLVAEESTATVTFEMKPYVTSKTFQSQVFDKEQRIGYFINFATQKQVDEPVPQMTRWDIDSSLGPILVRISESAPQAALQAMTEGILYWNRVSGKEILKIGLPFRAGEKQIDRSIHVFWIPWDTAGFARAGIQADPITGEIFRAQVFMTSSWYKQTNEAFKIALGTEKPNTPVGFSGCLLEQIKLVDGKLLLTGQNAQVEKATVDTIRIVLAHEMGHALGLRHNFAGSSTSSLSDSEYLNNHDHYLKGSVESTVPTSTTVMDYTRAIDTAINGAAILNAALPYDVAAIGFGYFGKPIAIGKYQYCSDEHIALATTQQKVIYGCDRFDSHKNMLLAQVDNLIESQKNQTITNMMMLLSSGKASKSFYAQPKTLDELLSTVNYSGDAQAFSLDPYLYQNSDSYFVSLPSIIDSFLQSLSSTTTLASGTATPQLKIDAMAVGGLGGIFDRLLSLEQNSDGKFYETQVLRYFENFDSSITEGALTSQDVDTIKLKMLEKARLADAHFLASITNALPLTKMTYSKDPITSSYQLTMGSISSAIPFGNLEHLIATYVTLYEAAIHKNAAQVKIDNVDRDYKFLSAYDNELDTYRKYFSPSNRPSTLDFENSQRFAAALEKIKAASVANTIEILKFLGITVPAPISSAQLTELVSHIDWSRISGITIAELTLEINELNKLEQLK